MGARSSGLSSLALVNNPNMPLTAPTLHTLNAREAELARRETAAEREYSRAAEMVVNMAIFREEVAVHHRDHYLNAIRSHEDGIVAGLNAFVELGRSGGLTPRARFTAPDGYEEPAPDRISLHSQIAHRATRQGVTYRVAACQVAAEAREIAVPEGYQAASASRMRLNQQISATALQSGVKYREAAEQMGEHARVTVPSGAHPPREERMALHGVNLAVCGRARHPLSRSNPAPRGCGCRHLAAPREIGIRANGDRIRPRHGERQDHSHG